MRTPMRQSFPWSAVENLYRGSCVGIAQGRGQRRGQEWRRWGGGLGIEIVSCDLQQEGGGGASGRKYSRRRYGVGMRHHAGGNMYLSSRAESGGGAGGEPFAECTSQ